MWKKYFAYMKSPAWWVMRIVLVMLCLAHDAIGYRAARSLMELLYWPDGFCPDMLVVSMFFATAATCIYGDIRFLIKSRQLPDKEC